MYKHILFIRMIKFGNLQRNTMRLNIIIVKNIFYSDLTKRIYTKSHYFLTNGILRYFVTYIYMSRKK